MKQVMFSDITFSFLDVQRSDQGSECHLSVNNNDANSSE